MVGAGGFQQQLIWRHISAPEFYVIANFEEEPGKTRVVFKMIFNNAEICAEVKKYALPANEENFDRLGVELGSLEKAF